MMNRKNRTGGIDNMRKVFVLVLVSLIVMLTMPLIFTNVALANATDAGYINITADEAKQMIDENQSIVILDVRTLAEYNSGHIDGSKLIPLLELEERINAIDGNSAVIVYCGSGVKSEKVSKILLDHGFDKVYNMKGGLNAWQDAGFPVVAESTANDISPSNNSLSSTLSSEIEDILSSGKPVFLFFYVDWCHFCQQQISIIDELEQEYKERIAFVRINCEEHPNAMKEFGASGYPSMFLILSKGDEGQYESQYFKGFTDKETLKESIDWILRERYSGTSPENKSVAGIAPNVFTGYTGYTCPDRGPSGGNPKTCSGQLDCDSISFRDCYYEGGTWHEVSCDYSCYLDGYCSMVQRGGGPCTGTSLWLCSTDGRSRWRYVYDGTCSGGYCGTHVESQNCASDERCINGECRAACTVSESAYECICPEGSTEGKKHERGYMKVPDGCSAPIPPPFKDNPVGLPGCSFKDACDAHDCCYGTCNSNKATCDNAFHGDMMQICKSSCLHSVVSCTTWATTYYGAVFAFGGTAYSNNQDLACEKCWCCPEGTPNAGTEYTPQNPEDGCCAYSGGCRSGNLDPEECRICYGGTWHPGKKCCDGNCHECCTDDDCQHLEGHYCDLETHTCEEEVPEFPAGVTAVFGATLFIFLMMRRKYIEK